MRITKPMAVLLAAVLAASVTAWAADSRDEKAPEARARLPIIAEGGGFEEGVLSREVVLPTPGVWYVWLKVTSKGWHPAALAWDLDGAQPLHSSRSRVVVGPYAKSQWVSHTAYPHSPGFRTQVHVERPGTHTLNLRLLWGDVEVETVALTLYFSAAPKGETLDHEKDPGGGWAEFAAAPTQVDGFRKDWTSPAVECLGTTYYVDSEAGDDGNDGLAPERAWKSFAPVKARRFEPGDAILLKRDGKWSESLAPRGDGAPDKWITIGSYGDGARPYINGVAGPAISLEGQSYWRIQDLKATNEPDVTHAAAISVVAPEGEPQPRGIEIRNCIAFDAGGYGIHVGSPWGGDGNGYDGVVLDNCLVFANGDSGIQVNGNDQDGCRNTVIRNCTAYSNRGMAGIWIQSGQNGLIEHCVGYNNNCFNIWTWNAINITIRYCEAFRGTPPSVDMGGFDIDWGSQACTLEYCYSHHNEGAGILLMGNSEEQYRGFPKQSHYNICRYNISENFMSVVATFEYGKVYNNIVVSATDAPPLGVGGWPMGESWDGQSGGWTANTEFYNNVAISLGPSVPLGVAEDSTKLGNVFDHNLYWRAGEGGLFATWGGHTDAEKFWQGKGEEGRILPQEFATFEGFQQATGQEANGLYADPLLPRPDNGGLGRLPLEAYLLSAGSPALGAGRPVELSEEWLAARRAYLTDTGAEAYGIPMEPSPVRADYWGTSLDPGRRPSMGAQAVATASPQ